jgi:hypothetical protein
MRAEVTVVAVTMAVGASKRTVRVEYLPLDGQWVVERDCVCPRSREWCVHCERATTALGAISLTLARPQARFRDQGGGLSGAFGPSPTSHPPPGVRGLTANTPRRRSR